MDQALTHLQLFENAVNIYDLGAKRFLEHGLVNLE